MTGRPFLRTFGVATVALALLFSVLGADPAAALPPLAAFLFWLIHVGVGLLLAVAVATALNRWPRASSWPTGPRLLAAGVGGALLFAPVAIVVESWFPEAPTATEADVLDAWEAAGGLAALAAEFLHLAPSYLLAWVLVNLTARFGAIEARPASPRAGEGGAAPSHEHADEASRRPAEASPAPSPGPASRPTPAPTPVAAAVEAEVASGGLLAALPPLIGRDVVHVVADLHYLHVHTVRGRAMLLGSLAGVEAELGEAGTRVHRSHWIAHRHVRRIARTAAGWYCELSTGQRVPISRRRVQSVRAQLGADFVIEQAIDVSEGAGDARRSQRTR